MSQFPSPGQPQQRRKTPKALALILILALVLGGGVYGGLAVFAPQVLQQFGLGFGPADYRGEGEGETQITIREGDIGSDVAAQLFDAGVIASSEAFTNYLLREHPDATFGIGTYQLRQKMSASAAFAALQDPANKIELRVTIPEGFVTQQAFERLAAQTGIPVAEFAAAAADYVALGVPESFPSIEGFLFPATYVFAPEDTARDMLQIMVDRMWQALAEHGVSAADAHLVLTKAALVQREAGQNPDDLAKIARVFENRLAAGKNLESDATVAYGTGQLHTVWTTDAERADASNKYNTYSNPGLPIGPIGLPGDAAIAAVLAPADGPWLFFVVVDLETGETAFSETLEEHEAAVTALQQWCAAHEAAGGTLCD